MSVETDYALQRYGLIGSRERTPANRSDLYPPIAVLDSSIDSTWASSYQNTKVKNPYYDYFYTGQDLIVTVDGTEDDGCFRVLPLISIGFNITQQKAPIYGFWDYTYSAVLRGTRLIQGSFTLATKSPNYVKQLLAKAAHSRQDRLGSANYTYNKGLTEDDENIEKYWGKNIDPALNAIGTSIYSVHPPFSLVLTYGVQNVSMNKWGTNELYDLYINDNPWMTDINERLIESDLIDQSNREVLDACEIQSMSKQVDPDGSIISETYTFFARELIVP